jgi:hypothetical protein
MVWSSKLRMALYAETPDPHSLNFANLGFCYEGIQWLPKLDLTRLQSTQRFENSYACLSYTSVFLNFFFAVTAMDSE